MSKWHVVLILRVESFHHTALSEISGPISSFAWTAVTGSWCYSIISTFEPWCLPLMSLKSVDDSLHLEPINRVWQKKDNVWQMHLE